MKLANWLERSTQELEEAGIGTARLDALVLLEDALSKDRSWLLAHPEYVIKGSVLNKLHGQVERRIRHEPLAYIRGKSEFYGRSFKVNAHTLEPRPETETMIELLVQLKNEERRMKNEDLVVVDVGTGSGCLAITVKLELPEAEVLASDIDPECLKIARKNAKALKAKVKFLQGDLLKPLPLLHFSFFILLCNLPYVPNGHTINQAAMFEPRHAIFGGPDGLDLYRGLFEQIGKMTEKPQYVLTESLPSQHKRLAQIAKSASYKQWAAINFIQCFKFK